VPDLRRANCIYCQRHTSEAGPISWSGACPSCGEERGRQALLQLDAHRGPIFQRWRARLAASVGAALLDDEPDSP